MEVLWNFIRRLIVHNIKTKSCYTTVICVTALCADFYSVVLACGGNLGVDMHTHTGGVGRNF